MQMNLTEQMAAAQYMLFLFDICKSDLNQQHLSNSAFVMPLHFHNLIEDNHQLFLS